MKYISLITYILGGISVLLVGLFMFNTSSDLLLDILMWWSYALVGIAVLVTLILPLINTIQNPKNAMRSVIGIAGVAVIVGIAFLFSSGETITTAVTVYDNELVLKLSDTGLYTTYVAFAAAIISVVAGEVSKTFK